MTELQQKYSYMYLKSTRLIKYSYICGENMSQKCVTFPLHIPMRASTPTAYYSYWKCLLCDEYSSAVTRLHRECIGMIKWTRETLTWRNIAVYIMLNPACLHYVVNIVHNSAMTPVSHFSSVQSCYLQLANTMMTVSSIFYDKMLLVPILVYTVINEMDQVIHFKCLILSKALLICIRFKCNVSTFLLQRYLK